MKGDWICPVESGMCSQGDAVFLLEANEPKIFSLFSPLMFMTKWTQTQKCYQEVILRFESAIGQFQFLKTNSNFELRCLSLLSTAYLTCTCVFLQFLREKTSQSSEDKWEVSSVQ